MQYKIQTDSIIIRYTIRYTMYRVVLKIHEIRLRIKQNVYLQLVIKRSNESFAYSGLIQLQKCCCKLQKTQQFFVDSKDPVFTVHILIVNKQIKKLAGIKKVSLQKFPQNSNCIIQEHLQESPDSQSFIKLQLLYMKTNYQNNERKLVNIQSLSYENMIQMAEEMQENNKKLVEQNDKLALQLERLKQDNRNLIQNKNQMEDNYQIYSKNQKNQKVRVMDADNYQEQMKVKMKELRNLMKQCEGQSIRDKIQQIFKL